VSTTYCLPRDASTSAFSSSCTAVEKTGNMRSAIKCRHHYNSTLMTLHCRIHAVPVRRSSSSPSWCLLHTRSCPTQTTFRLLHNKHNTSHLCRPEPPLCQLFKLVPAPHQIMPSSTFQTSKSHHLLVGPCRLNILLGSTIMIRPLCGVISHQ
jgi:hypothetical protein